MSIFTNSSVVKTQIEAFRGAPGPIGPTGPQGIQGPAGNDGVSPTITLTRETDGVLITTVDARGTHSEKIYDGKNGTGGSGAAIDDTTPSSTTTYSSEKIEAELNKLKEAIEELQKNGTGGSVITATARDLLITILRSGVYTDDQSANITALEAALSAGGETPDEPDVPPSVTTYTISNELINCTTSNSTATVEANAAYTATLAANDGYTLDGGTVNVTMGGTDITSTAYADGVITIAAVTGNVEIFVSAVAMQAEAELPEEGLLAYFDFRTATYDNTVSGGKTLISPTQGSGQLFMWANNSISEQNDYGLIPANTRAWQYDQNGGTSHTELGTAYTVIQLTYGEVPSFGFNYATTGVRWVFNPKYINTSGGEASVGSINGNQFNSDAKTDYNFTAVRANGTILTEIMDTSRTEFDGSSIDAFGKWLDKASGNISTVTDGASCVAMAIYNRALTDSEIEEAREFMKTLEVTA